MEKPLKATNNKIKQSIVNVHIFDCSPVAQAWNLAMFGNNHFFAFFNSSWSTDEILPGWELASGLAFSESKMAAKDGNRIMIIDISS